MSIEKHSIAVRVSRDEALAMGWVEPTDEERRNQESWRREFEQRRRVAAMVIPAAIRSLDAITDPTSRAILDHHSREAAGYRWTCRGCDQGCSCDSPEWPCSTVGVVARLHQIDLTDADLFGRPEDGSLDLATD